MNANLDQDMFSAYERVSQVKDSHEQELLLRPNVVGVGVGLREREGELSDEVVLVVMVSQKVPISQLEPNERIPTEIQGVKVDVQEVGDIRAGA